MNRFVFLQEELLHHQKKGKAAGGSIKQKAGTLSNRQWMETFDTPAYTFSSDPMNDERERDEELISKTASIGVPSFCELNSAKDAGTANFQLTEFNCRDEAGTPVPEPIRGNIQKLMNELEILRSELNKPVSVNSGYRTVAHNQFVGGESNSLHLCGMAADIKVAGVSPLLVHSTIEKLITAGKMKQGGLGLYDTFVHYDIRGTKARWNRQTRAASKSYFGIEMQAGFFEWPVKFGTGDSSYDVKTAAWIQANREGAPAHSGLKKVKYKSNDYKGYAYPGNSAKDPVPDWGVTDPAHKKIYDELRKELFSEGGASSINTYDNQIVTIGWGFSMKYPGGGRDVLKYSMAASPAFANELLKAGITIQGSKILYVDTLSKKLISDLEALQKIRWDEKVLTLLIHALETYNTVNVATQVKVFKEMRMKDVPAEVFYWPSDAVRLAVHLSHWLPVGISWSSIKNSGGDTGIIVKSFCRNLYAYQSDPNRNKNRITYLKMEALPNGALYVNDTEDRFDMGNRAFIKAGDAGLIRRIPKTDFTDKHKTEEAWRNYVFVELYGNIYLLP